MMKEAPRPWVLAKDEDEDEDEDEYEDEVVAVALEAFLLVTPVHPNWLRIASKHVVKTK